MSELDGQRVFCIRWVLQTLHYCRHPLGAGWGVKCHRSDVPVAALACAVCIGSRCQYAIGRRNGELASSVFHCFMIDSFRFTELSLREKKRNRKRTSKFNVYLYMSMIIMCMNTPNSNRNRDTVRVTCCCSFWILQVQQLAWCLLCKYIKESSIS